MARPTRQGIDYFPYDVDLDLDDKLQMIVAEFKGKGEMLFIKLCAWIYKTNGYYTEWNEDVQLRFLRRYNYCGFSVSFLNEVVPRCIKWGLFDQGVFNTFHILTSARIQATWLDATSRRKDCIIDEKMCLLEVSASIQLTETPLMSEEMPQSKVKEIKEKKSSSTGENGGAVSPPKKSLEEREREMVIRQQEFYKSLVEYVPTYGKEMIRAFYDYWSEPNKSRTKFKKEMQATWDSKLRLVTWEKNQERFGKGAKKQETPVTTGPSVREVEEAENRKKLGIHGKS
ncbi:MULTISPECIES: DUF4373 domain-containing protein [Niastella]|uniref:DUF4373 domain-containing protein n=1 Tax=Niastella soli TaxID=2821487 RepID=A0ABS3Z120_9BACT|nr:DUF4373 domain-containing protein [Niastella soli]MBO9203799.1 DUF4373 domain-containing protein [Niastella soli]